MISDRPRMFRAEICRVSPSLLKIKIVVGSRSGKIYFIGDKYCCFLKRIFSLFFQIVLELSMIGIRTYPSKFIYLFPCQKRRSSDRANDISNIQQRSPNLISWIKDSTCSTTEKSRHGYALACCIALPKRPILYKAEL